eukprot:1085294-Alexandrium_andersonii.AAC.1
MPCGIAELRAGMHFEARTRPRPERRRHCRQSPACKSTGAQRRPPGVVLPVLRRVVGGGD